MNKKGLIFVLFGLCWLSTSCRQKYGEVCFHTLETRLPMWTNVEDGITTPDNSLEIYSCLYTNNVLNITFAPEKNVCTTLVYPAVEINFKSRKARILYVRRKNNGLKYLETEMCYYGFTENKSALKITVIFDVPQSEYDSKTLNFPTEGLINIKIYREGEFKTLGDDTGKLIRMSGPWD